MRWALPVLLLKLIAIVGVCVSIGWWFKTAPPPDLTANEQTFNSTIALLTAGMFSAVIALLDRSNVVLALKLYICCGVFAAIGITFGAQSVNDWPENGLNVGIAATLAAYGLSKVPIRFRGN
jgi:hypothetical protein